MYQSAGMSELLEISDLIVDYDPQSLVRRDVRRSEVVHRLRQTGQYLAASIARQIPADNDVLNQDAVDLMLLRAHSEIQRLSEEFSQGERVLYVSFIRPRHGLATCRLTTVGKGFEIVSHSIDWGPVGAGPRSLP